MAAPGDDLKGLEVLLVDDNQDAALAMARLLDVFGCRTTVRLDAATTLASAEALSPDVVILDIRLPDLPGTELCRRLREIGPLREAMFVALTGATDQRTLVLVEEAGFHRRLAKPVELDRVLEVLGEAARPR